MNVKRIMIATDFSDSSDAALSFASSLAAESGALLDIVHVSEPTESYYAGYGAYAYTPALADEVADLNRERLATIKPTAEGVRHEHHDLRGVPAPSLLAFAEKEGVDLIVIGSHGRTGLVRMLMGSVAEEVVRRAKCPVLTVKQPAETADETTDADAQVSNT